MLSAFRLGDPDGANAQAESSSNRDGPLRLSRPDEPHMADGSRRPAQPPPSAHAQEESVLLPPASSAVNPLTLLGGIGRTAQAAIFASLRTLGQPLYPPPERPSSDTQSSPSPPNASSPPTSDLLHRDPYAASRQRQSQRQALALTQEEGAPSSASPVATRHTAPREEEHNQKVDMGSSPSSMNALERPLSADSTFAADPSTLPPNAQQPARRKRAKAKKSKVPPEQLVIVRPPPTKHAHNWNLQVQLVSRQNRERGNTSTSHKSSSSIAVQSPPRASFESEASRTSTLPPDPTTIATDDSFGGNHLQASESRESKLESHSSGEQMNRRASVISNQSRQSMETEAGVGESSLSLNSSVSTGSGMNAHRSRVIPLYNLTFHSLLPSIVSDAGTDERVAKVSKKGQAELDGLMVLEPSELGWGLNDIETVSRFRPANRTMPPTAHATPHSTLVSHPTPLELVNEGPSTPGSTTSRDPFTAHSSPNNQLHSPSISLNGVPATLDEAGSLALQQPSSTRTLIRPTSAPFVHSSPTSPTIPRSATATAHLGSSTPNAANKRNALFGRNATTQPNEGGNKFFAGIKRFVTPRNNANKKTDPSTLTRTLSPAKLDPPSATQDPERRLSTSTTKSFELGSRASLRGTRPGDGVPMWPIERKASTRRAQGYVWTVRKWLRKSSDQSSNGDTNHTGLRPSTSLHSLRSGTSSGSTTFGKVWSKYNLVDRAGGYEPAPSPATVPIRIEWTRDSSRARRHRANEWDRALALAQLDHVPSSPGGRPAVARGLPVPTRDISTSPNVRPHSYVKTSLEEDQDRGRGRTLGQGTDNASLISFHGTQPNARSPSATRTENTTEDFDDDSGNDSDPEDSEAPWRCALVLGCRTRVPLALLTPAPHHPRLVGQLTVPFPLPDLRGSGLGPDRAGLAPENLKDLVSVTALHLVVREGFGAMAKSKRT